MLGQQQKMSLSAEDMVQMHKFVNANWSKERVMWYPLVVSFRTLWRKCNLLPLKDGETLIS